MPIFMCIFKIDIYRDLILEGKNEQNRKYLKFKGTLSTWIGHQVKLSSRQHPWRIILFHITFFFFPKRLMGFNVCFNFIFFNIWKTTSVTPAWVLTSSAWYWYTQIKARSPSWAWLAHQANVVKCDDFSSDRRQSPFAFPWVQRPLAAPNPVERKPFPSCGHQDLQHDPAWSCIPNQWTWKLCWRAPKTVYAGPRTDW